MSLIEQVQGALGKEQTLDPSWGKQGHSIGWADNGRTNGIFAEARASTTDKVV